MRDYNGFLTCVKDLTDLDDIQRLDEFSQHFNTSRLQHSFNVAYVSYRICKKLGWDFRSAARAGILHDFYLYDWRVQKQPEGRHVSAHPQVALKNARRITILNHIEEDAIVKHMWPLTIKFPRYKESYVVTLSDKLCAAYEFAYQTRAGIKRKLHPASV